MSYEHQTSQDATLLSFFTHDRVRMIVIHADHECLEGVRLAQCAPGVREYCDVKSLEMLRAC